MSAGAQVASIMRRPLFLFSFKSPSELSSSWLSLSDSCFFTSWPKQMISLISFMICAFRRFRKWTIIEGSKGASFWNSGSPIKYWRYGFSLICSTTSSSENPPFSLMSKAPRAMRTGLAGAPVLFLANNAAYLSSMTSHGISFDNFTQRFSGSSCPPKGR